MSDRELDATNGLADPHAAAAAAFVSRARERLAGAIETIFVFGSTVRGDADARSSDVDVLVVLSEDADRAEVEDVLGDIAYDVMLEFGPVVELHLLTRRRFETLRDRQNPFVQNVVREGRSYG